MFLARTLLFTPANRPERFEKARQAGSDGIIIDLEDAVAWQDKASARDKVIDYLQKRQNHDDFIEAVRINSVRTPAGLKDLAALIDNDVRPDMLVLPKSESAHEITIINDNLSPHKIPILALIETAQGLNQAHQIASMPQVEGLIFGGGDFAADLGATMDWEPMYSARAQVVQAAAGGGIAAIDVPYLNLKAADNEALIEETQKIKAMGYACKLAIHPKHIEPILSVLTPSEDEVKQAQAIVDAYESAHGNAAEYNGKMIDVPVYRSAKRILQLVNH